jgi:hypothetical protein
MRRIPMTVLAIAVAVVPAVASAQRAPAFAATTRAAVRAAVDTAAASKAQAIIQRADARWHAYDLAGARRDYALAVEILKAGRVYAGPALEALAHVTYTVDSPERTAKVLIEAANEAASFGDLPLQVTSLFEASLLSYEAGEKMQGDALLARVERLLSSPYIPAQVKADIQRRMDR